MAAEVGPASAGAGPGDDAREGAAPSVPSVRELERIHRELAEIDVRVAAEEAAVIARGYAEALDADLAELRLSEGPLFDALPLPRIPPGLVVPSAPAGALYGVVAAPIGTSLPLWWSYIPGLGRPARPPGNPLYRRTFLGLVLDDRGLLQECDLVHDAADRIPEPRLFTPLRPAGPDGRPSWTELLPHGRLREVRGIRPFDPEGWLQRAGEWAPPLPEFTELLQGLVHAAVAEAQESLRARLAERVTDLERRQRRVAELRARSERSAF